MHVLTKTHPTPVSIADSYFKLTKKNAGMMSGDPSGFTWVDTVRSRSSSGL